jgi:NADPH-dependent ferric siderophore reductase
MTTAEFGKANLAKIDDVVEIRRYSTVVGTFYPAGTAAVTLQGDETPLKEAARRIEELEEEVKALKRLLAAKSAPIASSSSVKVDGDPFAGLAKQDRDFFERKLGKKK